MLVVSVMVEIKSFDHQGRGIGKIDNKVVFVKNALPGEIVEIIVNDEKKKFMEASIKKINKTSKNRIKPMCPYFEKCGGCNLMHISYENQLNFKKEKIENIVTKYLNQEIRVNNIVKSSNELNYRNKITFQVNNNIGFYEEKTNNFIKIDKCLICNDIINKSIKYLNRLELKSINKIICKNINNKLMIIVDTNNKNLDISCLKEIADSIYIKDNGNYLLKYGQEYEEGHIDNYSFTISPDSFFQINLDVATKILKKIKNEVGCNNTILDLYCGTGIIGIYISDNNKVIGVEINKQAYLDALNNKKNNKLSNIDFICNDSGKSIKELNINPDIVIIDPPRGGLNSETIKNILELEAKKIIYVSCNPITLVRDLNHLKDKYTISEITPFDMFPQTYHVECIAILNKNN